MTTIKGDTGFRRAYGSAPTDGASAEALRELAAWGAGSLPVTDAAQRAVEVKLEMET